jgi:hypothetical protein
MRRNEDGSYLYIDEDEAASTQSIPNVIHYPPKFRRWLLTAEYDFGLSDCGELKSARRK